MTDSDMDISGESDNEYSRVNQKFIHELSVAPSASHDSISQIPMPPLPTSTTDQSGTSTQKSDGGKRYMSLKKRWLQNIEKEPKKRKVSLEAYRKRHVSGGESGESARSPSDIGNASSHLQDDVKLGHKLASEERDRQSGRRLQKMTIGDLERRKIKLKEALRKIEASSSYNEKKEKKQFNGNQEAKSEFDKFMEKQSRWLAKRAREKQREAKIDKFNSSIDHDLTVHESMSSISRHVSHSPDKRHLSLRGIDHHRKYDRSPLRHSSNKHPAKKHKQVAVVRPRGQSELTSTLLCLQKAKDEVQRQLSLLKSPSDSPCRHKGTLVASTFSNPSVIPHSSDKPDT